MTPRLLSLLLLLGSAAMARIPDRSELRGIVTDAATGQTLAAANVRVLGSSLGTICNTDGRFALSLPPGTYTVVVSSLGYRPDTLRFELDGSVTRTIALQPSEILLPEVVVTSEDPALAIIRRAIESKRKWAERLATYEMEAFTRQTVRRDTAIAAIAESYTRGYWQRGDTLREVVLQRRQTANLGAAENFAAVGRILNFNEDRIRFVGFTFVGPTADDALDYYDYRLVRTRTTGEGDLFEIRMTPRSRTVPLFTGTVMIADGSYALVGVDVEPNEAFVFPFVRERILRYRQQFSLYDRTFWMPADIRVEGRFRVSLLGFTSPVIGIEQTSVIYRYGINVPVPDSVFRKPRITIDSTATRTDSSFWASTQVLPLNAEEQKAYAGLDSTQRLDVQFRPGGVGMTLGAGGEGVAALLQYLDLGFNRVEGFRFGGKFDREAVLPWLDVRGAFAYGFSDKKSKYVLGATIYPLGDRVMGVSGDWYSVLDHRPDAGYYGSFFNSLTAFFWKNDYRDYHRAEGWKAGLVLAPGKQIRGTLAFVAERHSTAEQRTEYSLFNRSASYRPNPEAAEGDLRSIVAGIRLGGEAVPLDLVTRDALELAWEYTDPSVAGSDFRFMRLNGSATVTVPLFGEGFLLRPQLRLRMAAGTSTGDLPVQRWFDLESASSHVGPFGVMRAMDVKEFAGTGYTAIALEQNFRSLPFLALGIPFLYERGIEFLVHGGVARAWSRDGIVPNPTDGWYAEAGFGIGRILDLFRCDFTWRVTAPAGFNVTVMFSSLL